MDDKNESYEKINKVFRMRGISLILLYSSVGIFFIGYTMLEKISMLAASITIFIGAACFIAFFVISIIFWKCPFCGERFELRHSRNDGMNYCPHCGSKLRG